MLFVPSAGASSITDRPGAAAAADTFAVYDFINYKYNYLENYQLPMEHFFSGLKSLTNTGRGKLKVYHAGDSHVRATQFTRELGHQLQERYGKAGGNVIYNKQKYYTRYVKRRKKRRLVRVKGGTQEQVMQTGATSENGIEFNTFGVSGKTFRYYLKTDILEKHLKKYSPDLVIISLGTNESFGPRVAEEEIYSDMKGCLDKVRKYAPKASVIFTTPPDCYRKRAYNDNVLAVRNTMIRFARENNIACWDLFAVMGGMTSRLKWFEYGLSQKDLIHFTPAGYRLQGYLLFKAIETSFNEYTREYNK